MKSEIELVRDTSPKLDSLPLAIIAARRALNESANALVHEGILANQGVDILAQKLAEMMITTARILAGMDLEPDLENFIYACAELVGNTRKVMDDALRFSNTDDFKLASVMMEVVLKGCAATLGLPFDDLMREVVAGQSAKCPPDIKAILNRAKESA